MIIVVFKLVSDIFHSVNVCNHAFFLLAAALALAAFLRLLLIITTLRKLPTTAPPSNRRMTGILIAQTRGGKIS
jgi:hypothetical protein